MNKLTIKQALARSRGDTNVYVSELGFREPTYYDETGNEEGLDIYFEDDDYDLSVGVRGDGSEYACVRKGSGPVRYFEAKEVLYCIPSTSRGVVK